MLQKSFLQDDTGAQRPKQRGRAVFAEKYVWTRSAQVTDSVINES